MRVLTVGCLLVAGFSAPAVAQIQHEVTAEVPFSFTVGDAQMTAGEYVIRSERPLKTYLRIVREPDGVTAAVRHNSRGRFALVESSISAEGASPKLIFNKYGEDRYFLAQVWDGTGGVRVVRSRRERELITSRVVAQAQPSTVTIMGRVRMR